MCFFLEAAVLSPLPLGRNSTFNALMRIENVYRNNVIYANRIRIVVDDNETVPADGIAMGLVTGQMAQYFCNIFWIYWIFEWYNIFHVDQLKSFTECIAEVTSQLLTVFSKGFLPDWFPWRINQRRCCLYTLQ